MANYRLSIRKIERSDMPAIITWARNQNLMKYLHIALPHNEQNGNQWFQRSLIDRTRDDFVIHAVNEEGERTPIGLLGLFNIDENNKKAEYYILIGNSEFTRRGIASRASAEMLGNCFKLLNYNKITVMVDKDHYEAQKLIEKLGFRKEGLLTQDIISDSGEYIDRFIYGITKSQYEEWTK